MFFNNKNLQKLNLGGNNFLVVSKNLLLHLISLRSLNLEGIDIDNYNATMFSLLINLEFIYFKRFKYCMYVPNVPKCYPSTDGSDLLMGFYLLIIGCQDLRYKGIFITHAREWMSSWLCTTAGVLAMTSSEVTVLLLFLISAERYLLIAAPLRRKKTLKPRVAFLSVSAVWMIGLIISSLPVLNWRDSSRFYGTNTFCFPLHIDEPYRIGWHYSTFIFIGLNSLGMLAIGFLYYGVLLSINKTRRETTLNVRDTEFVMRFFFIVLTNACCWVPVIILKVLAFLRIELSEEPMTLKVRLSRAISMISRQQAIYEPPRTQEEEL
ncbi:unnamed protein product [Nezara viridula]|uniref:G-protein coupled receptors family 1 profile domain-containing protein n=1 Tax=Nezara viridula TaxID=85310 RepID=A0A9P0HIB3_NEZVI|nr:unnamed protein product [Nezara viridula]